MDYELDKLDFKDYPKSITEARALNGNSPDWTPRDALINVLRDMDSGLINPSELVILHTNNIINPPAYVQAVSTPAVSMLMMQNCINRFTMNHVISHLAIEEE